jgi:serine/threonine-protein kinase
MPVPRFKVRLFYAENKPELKEKTFEVDYDITAETQEDALKLALYQFMNYQNYHYASWVRTLIEANTIVLPEIKGQFLDQWSALELIDLLDQSDEQVQRLIIDGIRWVPQLREAPTLVAYLYSYVRHPEPILRISATETLRHGGRLEVVELFARLLREEEHSHVISSMIAMIGERGVTSMLPLIREYLHHADDRVRANAVDALAAVGSKEDIPLLLELIDDPGNRVRANVFTALWRLGEFSQMEKLLKMLKAEEENMRASAVYVLGEMVTDRALKLLQETINDESALVRRNVVRSLNCYRPDQSIPTLIKMLADSNRSVVDMIAKVLISYGDQASDSLIKTLNDPVRKIVAREILAEMSSIRFSEGRFFDWLSLSVRHQLR